MNQKQKAKINQFQVVMKLKKELEIEYKFSDNKR